VCSVEVVDDIKIEVELVLNEIKKSQQLLKPLFLLGMF
jgi:hypothetical protein